jgi:hypothetical protein
MGALFCPGCILVLFLIEAFIQPAICTFGIVDIHSIIPLEHRWGLVPGKLHDHRLVHTCFAHVSVEGVAKIMEPEVGYFCLSTGTCKGLLDLLEGLSPISKNPIMIQRSDLADLFQYNISLIAKEDNPWL